MTFDEFFIALHGYSPFPWQSRLAEQIASGVKSVDAPTASGKTAVIDAWVWALATGRIGRRRLWYVVQRRILVDAAYERANDIANRMPACIQHRLTAMSATGASLQVLRLRGGVFEDTSIWDPTAAMVVCATADQHASRLLFRAYGVADGSLPVHAALAGANALVAVDEAHLIPVYLSTVEQCVAHGADLDLLTLTATPGRPADVGLTDADRRHPILSRRISKPKIACLIDKKGAEFLAREAKAMRKRGRRAVVVFCNTVPTAIDTAHRVPGAHLLTGRLREWDRGRLQETLAALRSGGPGPAEPSVVVATQTLEVGADLDFDGLITQAASLSSLRQRFGRLDRLGDAAFAEAVIARCDKDAVYGELGGHVWDYLQRHATDGQIDMSTASVEAMLRRDPPAESLDALPGRGPRLTPALVETWAQTSPRPLWDPPVGPFISLEPDLTVSLVWRADFGPDQNEWAPLVETCPPLSTEAAPVSIMALGKWAGKERLGVLWRGLGTAAISRFDNLTPGDVWLLPVGDDDGRRELGCTLPDSPADVADNDDRRRIFDRETLEALESEPIQAVLERLGLADWRRVEVTQRPRGVLISTRWPPTSISSGRSVELIAHSVAVGALAAEFARRLGYSTAELLASGMLHDAGKADPRMQQWMAAGSESLLAKSGHTLAEIRRLRPATLPPGWRHEALSLRLARPWSPLTQHLVAAHHGRFRPGIPPHADNGEIQLTIESRSLSCGRTKLPDLEAEGLCRWAQLLAEWGPWRLADQEAILVMADRIVSRDEQIGASVLTSLAPAELPDPPAVHPCVDGPRIYCPALRGDSLLGWLAAVGALRVLSRFRETLLDWRPGDRSAVLHGWELEEAVAVLYEHLRTPPPVAGEPQSYDEWLALGDWGPALGWHDGEQWMKSRLICVGRGQTGIKSTWPRLAAVMTIDKVREALTNWRYYRQHGMRWDSAEWREHAGQWVDPQDEGAPNVHGANRLGIEALPLLCAIGPDHLIGWDATTKSATWPLWRGPLNMSAVRALLQQASTERWRAPRMGSAYSAFADATPLPPASRENSNRRSQDRNR